MHALKNKALSLALILIGTTGIIIQTVLIREHLSLFYGNEIAIGSILSVWLLGTAIGSLLFSKISNQATSPRLLFNRIHILWMVTILTTLLSIRIIPVWFGITPGMMLGYLPMICFIMITSLPFCIVSGTLYTSACQLFIEKKGESSSSVYFLEAAGAFLGGLCMSFIFVKYFDAIQTILFILTLNIALYWIRVKSKNLIKIVIVTVFIIVSIYSLSKPLSSFLYQWTWYRSNVTFHDTRYGKIMIQQNEGQFSLFYNGLHFFSYPDPETAEQMVHLPIIQHPNPEQILIIGGGLNGSLSEILKYQSIKHVDYVEFDPDMIKLTAQYQPEAVQANDSERIHFHTLDGKRHLYQTDKKYDIICINLPNPSTIQLNRYYTKDFFKLITAHLSKDGIFSIALSAAENMIGEELSNYLGSIHLTLKQVFPNIVILPGETTRFIASFSDNYTTSDPDTIIRRLEEREIHTDYIRDYYLSYQLTNERRAYFKERILNATQSRINKDLNPIGYYFDAVLWATYFSPGFRKLFSFVSQQNSYLTAGVIFLMLWMSIWYSYFKQKNLTRFGIISSIFIVGLTEISLEYIYILGFQIIFGHVYHIIAIIIALYMAGLTSGSWMAIRSTSLQNKSILLLRRIQGFMLLCTGLFLVTLLFILQIESYPSTQRVMFLFLTALLILNGFLGGFQFIIAQQTYSTYRVQKNQAGIIYGIDLLGSSAGILLMSLFIIPILGIIKALFILLFSNLIAYLILTSSNIRHGK